MRVTIFGATGKTGGFVLEEALDRGWDVTALTRSPDKLRKYAGRVRVIVGPNGGVDAIGAAVDGADAVISAMGAGTNTLATFGPLIVAALRQARVSRFVSLIGASIHVAGDPSTLNMLLLRSLTRLIAGDVVADGDRYAQVIMASGLEYTLVRPPRLTLKPRTGRINSGSALKLGPMSSIGRADVAAFMVKTVADGLFIGEAPMIAQ